MAESKFSRVNVTVSKEAKDILNHYKEMHGIKNLDNTLEAMLMESKGVRGDDVDNISVVIDLDSRNIVEYSGYYDHRSVTELLDSIEEMLDSLGDEIGDGGFIKCNLGWERPDPDDPNSGYLVLEYCDSFAYRDETGEEVEQ